MRRIHCWVAAAAVSVSVGCGATARHPISAGIGPDPVLPPPETSLIPTVHVVSAKGWPSNTTPKAAPGTRVAAFASGLDHPRWLYVLPNGDVLVAETNGPPRSSAYKGIKGWFFKRYHKKAGGAAPSANRITLLRDADADGVAETRSALLTGLSSPFGMALVGDVLYVANADALVRFPYSTGQTQITTSATKVTDFPPGPLNHHWTKSLIASPDGTKLYVGIGSNSNVAERGMDKEEGRAAIWEIDTRTGTHWVFASGLRNPVGLAWESQSGVLWTVVNERDELGGDLVPDYLTSVRDGSFYGWPYYLLWISRRHPRKAIAARPRRHGDRSRLRTRFTYGAAGSRLCERNRVANAVYTRHVRRPARLLESKATQRLQGDLCALR